MSHLKTLQSTDVHHVVGGFWNDAHDFERSLKILGVFASTLCVLQDVLHRVRITATTITPLLYFKQRFNISSESHLYLLLEHYH